jgi:hypothetical protein
MAANLPAGTLSPLPSPHERLNFAHDRKTSRFTCAWSVVDYRGSMFEDDVKSLEDTEFKLVTLADRHHALLRTSDDIEETFSKVPMPRKIRSLGAAWSALWWHLTEVHGDHWFELPSWAVISREEFCTWLMELGFTGYCRDQGPEWRRIDFEEDLEAAAREMAGLPPAAEEEARREAARWNGQASDTLLRLNPG